MRSAVFPVILALAAALAGCASDRGDKWPSLAPRPGEISPLVPRTPLGACAGCGAEVFQPAPPPLPPAPQPVPADAAARLDAVANILASIEADYPAQRRVTEKAVAAAGAGADAAIEAEVQRSRLEAIFLPLSAQSQRLDGISDDLIGKADTAALQARIADLRGRVARLEAVRAAAGL